MKIFKTEYTIEGKINKNIVLISDIHYYYKKEIKHLNNLLVEIKKLNPNYICISGDITDKSYIKDEEELIKWLEKLTNISKVIVSIGNHEYYVSKFKKIYGLNKKFLNKISKINNLYLLDNDNIIIDNINFIGVTLPIEHYDNEEKKQRDFNNYLNKLKTYRKYYNILLCHTPINLCDEELLKIYNFDLILCGHTHGGIVPRIFRKIFKHGGLVTPELKIFPNNIYGHIKVNKKHIIITSGIRVISHINKFKILSRIFDSEIVKIKIKEN